MGPLKGVRAIEIGGIGPGPFCAMLLADLGAEVLRIDPVRSLDNGVPMEPKFNVLNRGRRSAAVDLKSPEGRDLLLTLATKADLLFEGFRPGVMERLALGPEDVANANPKLVYGRMTGWGQSGPMAQAAGHDLNYIALAGALFPVGPADDVPAPPLNLVGDFGGGGMLLAMGLLAGYIEAQRSGKGQVVDAAMVDGTATLMAMFFGMRAGGLWSDKRSDNLLDGGAPWYRAYRTSDGKFVSIAAIEPKFYRQLISLLELDAQNLPPQYDKARWPELAEIFQRTFASRTQAEWCALLEGTDACFAPVLELDEIASHPHMAERQTIITRDDVPQPAPSPRFSRTPGEIQCEPSAPGQHTVEALSDWGIPGAQIDALLEAGIISKTAVQ